MTDHETSPLIKERIRYFRIVRDIPYHIALGEEQDYCCATKPMILDKLLSTIKLNSRHIVCTFKWEKIGLPSKLLSLPHDEVDTHEFLIVFIPETSNWVRVDPSWDFQLQGSGLSIAQWDGLHDTSLGVIPEKIYSPEESEKLNAEEATMGEIARNDYLERNCKFFAAFNEWLEAYRVKSR